MILEAVPVTFRGTPELAERHEPGDTQLRRSPGPRRRLADRNTTGHHQEVPLHPALPPIDAEFTNSFHCGTPPEESGYVLALPPWPPMLALTDPLGSERSSYFSCRYPPPRRWSLPVGTASSIPRSIDPEPMSRPSPPSAAPVQPEPWNSAPTAATDRLTPQRLCSPLGSPEHRGQSVSSPLNIASAAPMRIPVAANINQ